MKLLSFAVWVSLLRLIWFFLRTGVLKLKLLANPILFEFFLCIIACYLCMLLFACDRTPGVWSVLLRVPRFRRSSARQVTLWSYPWLPSFYELATILKHCMSRILQHVGLGNRWWGRTYCPFIIKPLGVTCTLWSVCYAMLIDVDWLSEFMTDVSC